MAVAMRKKRAWTTRADDSESQETAAFEATVAAAKDTAAKSGAFLSTAKSDLTDHQRWLRAQSAAVERDRQRHERWLQRQRDYRVASARKERLRDRRRAMRQHALQAVRDAIGAGALFMRSWFMFAASKTWAGISSVGGLITRATAYVAHQTGNAARYAAARVSRGTSWAGSQALASARAGGSALVSASTAAASKTGALSRSAGRSLGSGWSAAAARSSVLAGTAGRAASRGLGASGRKASALQSTAKRNLASAFSWTKARAGVAAPALYVGMAKLGRQAERYARIGAAHAERIMPGASAKVAAPASEAPHGSLEPHATAAEVEQAAEIYGPFYEGFWVDGVSPNEPRIPEASPAPRRNEETAPSPLSSSLSSWASGAMARASTAAARTRVFIALWVAQAKVWANQIQARVRTRDVELSRMLMIAGAVLLICGGLLLGGGLFLRSGAGTLTSEAEDEASGTGIAWRFMETERPLSERAVFTLSGTPDSFRINGLSVSGVNLSDQPLTAVEGVLKPDVKRPDLKLTLEVDPQTAPEGSGDAEVQAVAPAGTVPAGAEFRLVFPFPPEAMAEDDGITVDEYFEAYGGLLLKLRYELGGTEKSLIQYLPPDALKAQLDEVSAGAGG